MENFIFCINVTFPIFLTMAVGFVLKNRGMLTDGFVDAANKFNFKVTLPCLLVKDMAETDFTEGFNFKFVIFCAAATTVCFFAIWIFAKLFIKKNHNITGAFVQASFRSSAAVMGVAFVQNIYGNSAMAPLMMLGAVPLYNIYSVIVLTFEGEHEDGEKFDIKKIKKALIGIITNPIIIGIFLGLAISLSKIEFPTVITRTVSNIAAMASPLAVLVLGASFNVSAAVKKITPAIIASIIKLVIQPLIFLPIAINMGFGSKELVAIIIMLASPTTPSCFIMAKSMNNDYELTAEVVVITTLLSALTLTGWLYILKSLSLI